MQPLALRLQALREGVRVQTLALCLQTLAYACRHCGRGWVFSTTTASRHSLVRAGLNVIVLSLSATLTLTLIGPKIDPNPNHLVQGSAQ